MNLEQSIEALQAQLHYEEVQKFLALLRLNGLSPQTLRRYLQTLRSLFERAGQDGRRPSQLTVADLRGCVADWQSRGLKPATVAGRVMVIKRFYGFLLAEAMIEADPSRRLPVPQLPKSLPKALTLEETRRLLATLGEGTPRALRDKALITLVYACGLRAGEVVSIRLEQLDLEDATLRVIGKGDKERRVFLKPQVVALLRRYIEKCAPRGCLFPSRSGAPIGPGRLSQMLKQYARRAGLPEHVSPHTLRHSCATHYLLGGAPITFVQGLLGHVNLRTTGQYTGLVDELAQRIARETPLAVELGPRASGTTLREPRAEYVTEDFRETAQHVESVLEWLSG